MENTAHPDSPAEPGATETATIGIAGMTCEHCVRRVERALRALPGIRQVAVDLAGGNAKVVYERGRVDLASMHAAVRKSGYTPS